MALRDLGAMGTSKPFYSNSSCNSKKNRVGKIRIRMNVGQPWLDLELDSSALKLWNGFGNVNIYRIPR